MIIEYIYSVQSLLRYGQNSDSDRAIWNLEVAVIQYKRVSIHDFTSLMQSSIVHSLSKPYHIGRGSARKHEIPQSAIPCYQYRLAKQKRDQENLSANGKL